MKLFWGIVGKFAGIIAVLMFTLCILGKICEYLPKPDKAFNSIYNRYIKRGFDIVITGTALLVLWPFYFIIGALIIIEDGFPIFYRADRGGYKNKSFRICKFRSMVKDADKIGGGTTALHDPRITKIGNILRKTKLDEIPQLGQVFLGIEV